MARFTYAQVLNVARQRHPRLATLVLDTNVIVLDINQIVLDLLDELGRSDVLVTQQAITYETDIRPGIVGTPALTAITSFDLPDWITQILAIDAIYGASGRRREVDVRRYETKVRDRPRDDPLQVLDEDGLIPPVAYLLWSDGLFALRKYGSGTMWNAITDLELVVAGRKTAATEATLTSTVPMPERALHACAERYAVLLGQRAGLGESWLRSQRDIAREAMDRLAEWAGDFLAKDEPFDPDVQ